MIIFFSEIIEESIPQNRANDHIRTEMFLAFIAFPYEIREKGGSEYARSHDRRCGGQPGVEQVEQVEQVE